MNFPMVYAAKRNCEFVTDTSAKSVIGQSADDGRRTARAHIRGMLVQLPTAGEICCESFLVLRLFYTLFVNSVTCP